MKITIITGPFGCVPPNGLGAVEKLWYDLALEFKKKGCNVTVVSKRPDSGDFFENEINQVYIKGYKRNKSIYVDLFFDFLYSIKCFMKIQKTDILVMNTFWMPLLCRFFGRKFSISIFNVQRYPKGQFRFYTKVDSFCCVSNAVEEELKRQLPSRINAVTMINNPIRTEVFTWQAKELTSEIVIMYHGRIHPEKGLDILVSSFKLLQSKYNNLKLILVGTRDISDGGGGDEYVERLKELAGEGLQWVDPIFNPLDLAKMISSCDIYCYPSVAERGETFGVAPLEAMGVGRPVIVSSLDCFTDFIEDGVNGFVFNHRSIHAGDELSDKIELLINNPELRERIGRQAFESSRKFSNVNIAAQYLSEFEQLLEEYG